MAHVSDADRCRMDEVTAGVQDNKSEKMRRLAAAGYSRGDIARYLGVRYQFVRNVMVAAEQAAEAASEAVGKGTESQTSVDETPLVGERPVAAPGWVWTSVGKGGSVTLPAAFLEAIGAAEGEQVQLALEGDVVRILGRAAALHELQDEVRRYVPEGVSLVDELLAERRAEAARESEDQGGG